MPQLPSDPAIPASDDPLAQLVAAPLAGQLIGPNESRFVLAEWADPGARPRSAPSARGEEKDLPSGPPRPIAPFHVHHNDDEAWYVLEGVLGFRLGEREVEASAGTAVFAPRGVPHAYWNARPTRARYLLIMTPNIRQLIDDLHLPASRDPDVMRAIYRRHDSDLLP